MAAVTVAPVQAAYILMDQRLPGLGGDATAPSSRRRRKDRSVSRGVHPGTPIWIDSRPIWDGDEDWYAMLVDQAVVVPGPITEALGGAARAAGSYVVIGVQEREPRG